MLHNVCKQDKKKLDSKCEKGIFIGYDKYSPAFNVYYPDTGKIQNHRLVKSITKSSDSQTQTGADLGDIERYGDTPQKIAGVRDGLRRVKGVTDC